MVFNEIYVTFFSSFYRHLGSQLCELEKLIDKMMIAEFSTYSHSDLNRPLEDDCQVLEEVCILNHGMKLMSLLSVNSYQLQFRMHSWVI